jgi:putative membrane protein
MQRLRDMPAAPVMLASDPRNRLMRLNGGEPRARLRVDLMKKSLLDGAVAVSATLAPISAALAETPAEPYAWGPHMMWGWGWGWYGMIFAPLFMIQVLALVIAVAVLLVRWLGGPWQATAPPQAPAPRTPLDILKERYARGEIDKEEFEERRRVLGG